MAQPTAILLMGPTASGKTALAVHLAERLPLEIVSVDSAMIYRGMDIGTAKPDAEVLARAPHRLIDFLDPAEPYSAARFRDDALREMDAIRAAGKVPLLVGGTMLYFAALERGLSDIPPAAPGIRAAIEIEASERGWGALHDELKRVDPAAAARIHPNDPQRLSRALEVWRVSGRPLSEFQNRRCTGHDWRFRKFILARPSRAELAVDIATRFRQMLDAGLIGEVEALHARGDLHRDLPSMRAVGYRQVWQYLDGDLTYEALTERGIIATRQYAKRQLTWLRRERNAHWLEAGAPGLADWLCQALAGQVAA